MSAAGHDEWAEKRAPNFVSGGLRLENLSRTDICETCPYLMARFPGTGGWCSHATNRVPPMSGWPNGFTPSPSVAADGGCDLHPARAEGGR